MIHALRTLIGLVRERKGAAAVEFALIAPALCLLAVGTAQFGLVLSQYIVLTEAVSTGARTLAVSRGAATPYTSTVNAVNAAAQNLIRVGVTDGMTITTRINGTACAADPACQTALTSAAGQPASVTLTYPCVLTVYGYNFAPSGCTLSSTTVERIE